MRLCEKSQQRTVEGLLHEARERAQVRLVCERRVQQLGRNEVSGDAAGADQVREQGAGEFRTEEICLQTAKIMPGEEKSQRRAYEHSGNKLKKVRSILSMDTKPSRDTEL